jgi:hypothetical protein
MHTRRPACPCCQQPPFHGPSVTINIHMQTKHTHQPPQCATGQNPTRPHLAAYTAPVSVVTEESALLL